jgi:hypothetical protein
MTDWLLRHKLHHKLGGHAPPIAAARETAVSATISTADAGTAAATPPATATMTAIATKAATAAAATAKCSRCRHSSSNSSPSNNKKEDQSPSEKGSWREQCEGGYKPIPGAPQLPRGGDPERVCTSRKTLLANCLCSWGADDEHLICAECHCMSTCQYDDSPTDYCTECFLCYICKRKNLQMQAFVVSEVVVTLLPNQMMYE